MEIMAPTLKGSCEHHCVRMQGTGCESTEELKWLVEGQRCSDPPVRSVSWVKLEAGVEGQLKHSASPFSKKEIALQHVFNLFLFCVASSCLR